MLSKAELATAMPKAGGDYFYIDRSMGPAMGKDDLLPHILQEFLNTVHPNFL